MSTSDHPENMGEVDLDSIQRRRRINQSGTAESNVTPETVGKLSSWNSKFCYRVIAALLTSLRCARPS